MKEEKNNYVVYKHITPDGMVYVGITKNIKGRWNETQYNHKPFVDWINQYGWDNIIHEVVYDGLYKEEAALIESNLIDIYSSIGKSLNHYSSGFSRKKYYDLLDCGLIDDCKNMMTNIRVEFEPKYLSKVRFNEKNKDKSLKYINKFHKTVEGKIYRRVMSYNQYRMYHGNPNEIYETPLEAKQKYLDSGYIPNYIKNDDLM